MRLLPIENLSVVPYISKITLVTLAVLKKHIFYSTCELARCYVPDKQHFPPPAAIFKLKCILVKRRQTSSIRKLPAN